MMLEAAASVLSAVFRHLRQTEINDLYLKLLRVNNSKDKTSYRPCRKYLSSRLFFSLKIKYCLWIM